MKNADQTTNVLVLAGMHRSGTSLTSSLLQRLGIDMGSVLVPPDPANPRGYYEDADFVRLHQRMLECATRTGDGGHRDWGWTESEFLDEPALRGFRDEAESLVRQRTAVSASPWGWKDPRTTLLLDFWDAVLDDARFVFVYRHPWEVADSMQRLGAPVFLENPEYGYKIWCFYNRNLLSFYRREADRCLLLSSDALVRDPSHLRTALREKFGLSLTDAELERGVDPGSFASFERGDPLSRLVSMTSPEVTTLLEELDDAADLPGARFWSVDDDTRLDATATPPNVSVVTPCFDHGQFLIESVASVERHAPRGTELILVDDGSSEPRTLEVLDVLEAADYRIVRQANTGLSGARNAGIRTARGRYILPLDADNRIRSGFIEKASSVLDSVAKVGVVYGDCWEFGRRSGRREVPDFEPVSMLWTNTIDACAVFRREVWEQLGGYDPGMLAWEDWDFWLGAYELGWGFHRLPEVMFDYRVRPKSLVSRTEHRPVRAYLLDRLLTRHQAIYGEHQKDILIAAWDRSARLYRDRENLQQGQLHLEAELRRHQTEFLRMREDQRRHRRELEEKTTELQRVEGEFQAVGAEFQTVEAEFGKMEERVRRLDQEVLAMEEQARRAQEWSRSTVEAHDEVLAQLRSSVAWRVLSGYQNMLNRVLPPGAGRRRVYDRAIRLLKRQSA